jgi:uridine kinase
VGTEHEAIASVLRIVERSVLDDYNPHQTVVIAIGGRLGAGKSTLRRKLFKAVTTKFSSRLKEIGSVVIQVRLDDMVKPWEERGRNDTFSDKVDEDMVYAVEQALVDGRVVQKYMLAYSSQSWRLVVDAGETDALKANGSPILEEGGRVLLRSSKHTNEYRARGIISPVSEVYVDISAHTGRYNTIERFDPRGHLVILEGASVALNEAAAQKFAALLYIYADDATVRENVMMRAAQRYHRHSWTLAELFAKSERDDAAQRQVGARAEKHCTMVVDNSRPSCSPDEVLAVLDKKMSTLKRSRSVMPEQLYEAMARSLDAIRDAVTAQPIPRLTVTRTANRLEAHISTVLDRVVFHGVLDAAGGLALSEEDRDHLRSNIEAYLNDRGRGSSASGSARR